jgi:hypothetical protein
MTVSRPCQRPRVVDGHESNLPQLRERKYDPQPILCAFDLQHPDERRLLLLLLLRERHHVEDVEASATAGTRADQIYR